MIGKQVARTLAAGALTALVAACGSTPPIPDDYFYRLVPTTEFKAQPAPSLSGVLVVERPDAAGARRDRPITYSEPPHLSFRQYHYQHWEEPPPVLLHRRLLGALRQSQLAGDIAERVTADADYRLQTRINRFERLVGPGNAQVVVEIDVRLTQSRPAQETVLRKTYQRQLDSGSGRMDDTITAFSRAVDEIIGELIEDLRNDE